MRQSMGKPDVRTFVGCFRRAAPRFLSGSLAAFLLVLLFFGSGTAAQPKGLEGDFSLIAMVHTPDWPMATDVAPWEGKSEGVFVYRAIPCSGNAPVNNISSDLPTYNTRIPGSRSPASTRSHPMRLTVEKGSLRGTIAFTVCKLAPGPTTDGRPDAERDKILVEFQAAPERFTAEEVTFRGTFRITGGTGRYADLTGQGSIAGYLFCYDPRGCVANEGRYRDGQFVMHGTFFDPTGPE